MAEPPVPPMSGRPPMSSPSARCPALPDRNRTSGCRMFGYCPPWWCWPGRSSQSSRRSRRARALRSAFAPPMISSRTRPRSATKPWKSARSRRFTSPRIASRSSSRRRFIGTPSDYLVADTRFWVVRPRVNGGNVTGLGTLVSGAYIGVDVGHSSVERRTFTGLEVPPVVTSGLPGRQFVLHAEDIGSLTIGSTVFYRHIPAGRSRRVRSRSGRRQRHHQGVRQFALR